MALMRHMVLTDHMGRTALIGRDSECLEILQRGR
jgi:hypothetical protein